MSKENKWTFEQYDIAAASTAIFPKYTMTSEGGNYVYVPVYATLGLSDEFAEFKEKVLAAYQGNVPSELRILIDMLDRRVGAICGHTKKILRDGGYDKRREEIKKELGDVLWYLSAISTELGFTLEEVAKANIEKLSSRKERGAIKGDGDNR